MTMTFAQQMSFIVASYAVTAFVIVTLIAWVVLDYSSQRRILGDLEARGLSRRSQRATDES